MVFTKFNYNGYQFKTRLICINFSDNVHAVGQFVKTIMCQNQNNGNWYIILVLKRNAICGNTTNKYSSVCLFQFSGRKVYLLKQKKFALSC